MFPMKSFMKHLQKNKLGYLYAAAFVMLLSAVILGIFLGASMLSPRALFNAILKGELESPEFRIFIYVRVPRVAASLVCGAALAVSGAVIQGVLANRLASPSIIGVNSGAALAVTLSAAFGVTAGWQFSLFSFIGAFLSALAVSLAAKKWGASRGTVILAGVALSSLLGAISDAVTAFFPDISIINRDFKIGDFSFVTYSRLLPASVAIVAAIILLMTLSTALDVLTLGDENAKGLGLNLPVARVIFLLLAALLSGAAVSICGLLSFVGLLVPHTVRRFSVYESRHLLPLTALFGAGFVSLSDTLSRIIFAPFELPVGIIMALIGAPFFIFILVKGRRDQGHA